MEWIGLVSLVLILCYASYPGRVKHLEATMKKVQRQQKGENVMSKLIHELVNKECKIGTEDALALVGNTELLCHVLDADDEWIKVYFTDKKKNKVTKLIRIENISEIEIIENDINEQSI